MISTGMDGPALLSTLPCSSNMARTLPMASPETNACPCLERALLDDDRGQGPLLAVQPGLEDDALGRDVGVGLELEHVAQEEDHLEQVADVLLLLGRDLDADRLAAPVLDQEVLLGQLLLDPLDIGLGLVDLVDGHDDRHVGRPGVVDGFFGLGHDAVVGGDDEDHDVRGLRPAGPETREGLVTRRIDEGDDPVLDRDAVSADVLGDAARLLVDEVRRADGIEQGGLAVVDVPHDRDDRRARPEVRGLGLRQLAHGLIEADEFRVEVRRLGDGRGRLGVDEVVEVGLEALGGELLEQVLGPDLHRLGGILEKPAFAEGDGLARLRRRRRRSGLGWSGGRRLGRLRHDRGPRWCGMRRRRPGRPRGPGTRPRRMAGPRRSGGPGRGSRRGSRRSRGGGRLLVLDGLSGLGRRGRGRSVRDRGRLGRSGLGRGGPGHGRLRRRAPRGRWSGGLGRGGRCGLGGHGGAGLGRRRLQRGGRLDGDSGPCGRARLETERLGGNLLVSLGNGSLQRRSLPDDQGFGLLGLEGLLEEGFLGCFTHGRLLV